MNIGLSAAARLAAAAAIIAATVGAAGNPVTQTTAPVGVISCTAYLNAPGGAHPDGSGVTPYGYLPQKLGGIKVDYVNHAPQTVTKVDFLINYRGDIKHVVAGGTFSTGATISRSFDQFYGDNYNGDTPDTCSVGAITYADGTTWKPAAP